MSNHWCEGKTRRREERATSTRGKGLVNDKSAADRYHGEGALRAEPEGAIAEVKWQLMHYARMILARQEYERHTV
mgnify:CR=1 FL=1